MTSKTKFIFAGIVVLVALICAFAVWKLHSRPTADTLNITTTTGNYGLFIDNLDSGYFSTTDANVKRIVQAYLTNKDAKTDSDKYGYSLVFYYTKDNFITEGLFSPTDRNSVSSFVMNDMKTGKSMFDCFIYAQAGLYKDTDLLLSVSFINNGVSPKFGACLYQRGAPNFTFIDLTSQLGANETLFDDPAGRNLHANIRNVDTQKQIFFVDVYDTGEKDADGNYAYKRSIEVSYNVNVKLGIQDPIDQDIVGKNMVLGTNTWKGYVDGKLTTVTGTAYRNDPSQGVLFVWEPVQTESNIENGQSHNNIESSRTYLAPTATGPLKVVSEQNDVLTIQSVAGTYEVYDINTDTRTYVTTKGGATYFFVLPTREFEQ